MNTSIQDFHHRRHTLDEPRGSLARLGRTAHAALERFVARVSVHGDPPVYDPALFPWSAPLAAGWREMRAELDRVMQRRAELPNFQDILPAVGRITADDRWKTYWLAGIGMDCRANAARCPQTMQLLRLIPGLKNAFFSVLAPGKHIPAHRGAYNGVLRLHLALKVPQPAERCRIRIANQTLHWREGEVLIFDDGFQHEVWNDADGERVVLFVDFARPLRPPWHRLNERLLDSGRLAPFLREADARQRRWAAAFHSRHG